MARLDLNNTSWRVHTVLFLQMMLVTSCLSSPVISSNTTRQPRLVGYRNGGYPKFPLSETYKIDHQAAAPNVIAQYEGSCGDRRVLHELRKPSARIVGGSATPYGAYPWTANIEFKYGNDSQHHCGGTIITSRHILTAAHCIHGYKMHNFVVKVGDDQRSVVDKDEETFAIKSWRIHAKFKIGGPYTNDVAVLKLDGEVPVRPTVSAACMPSKDTKYEKGTWCYVSGWGITNSEDYVKPERLQAVSIPLLSSSVCTSDKVHGKFKMGPGMVCAGHLDGGVDACSGDSGGPLVCKDNGRYRVLGIVSWGNSCAKVNKPGVYTNVKFYQKWIDAAVKTL